MRRFFFNLFICLFVYLFIFYPVFAQSPAQGERYAACDLCGFCPPNPAPQSWKACQKCLYPNINPDPQAMESLSIDPETNTPISAAPGRMYTFLGCLGGGGGFTEEGAGGSVVQSILNVVFSISGGIAFLYLLYGSFTIATSQSDPEKLNYGRRLVSGAIIGLVFTLSSVLVVNFIASNVLRVPGFGGAP
jgi:hypothetical protein